MQVHKDRMQIDKIEYIEDPRQPEFLGWYICTYDDIGKAPVTVVGPYETQAQASRLLHSAREGKENPAPPDEDAG